MRCCSAPRVAHRYEDNGLASRPLEEVRRGDGLLVQPGEVVPVDGVVLGLDALRSWTSQR